MSVALVTDSTACLPAEVVAERGIAVVPLQVVIGATAYDEGVDTGDGGGVTPQMLADALRDWTPVSTSRPNPDASSRSTKSSPRRAPTRSSRCTSPAELSGTFESAQLAARRRSVPVTPVDSRQVGMGTGFAVLAAADATRRRGRRRGRGQARADPGANTSSLFYVDTLEYLRRGGRMGAAAALVGSALAVKPILTGRRRPGRPVREGAHLGQGAEPARGARRRGGR